MGFTGVWYFYLFFCFLLLVFRFINFFLLFLLSMGGGGLFLCEYAKASFSFPLGDYCFVGIRSAKLLTGSDLIFQSSSIKSLLKLRLFCFISLYSSFLFKMERILAWLFTRLWHHSVTFRLPIGRLFCFILFVSLMFKRQE